jgi:hypothetical protein
MWKKLSTIIISTLIAAAIIAYMLFRVWDDLLVALEHAIWHYLLIGTLVCLAAWWLRGFRYQAILASLGVRVSNAFSTACIFVSQTANLVVPARLGDLVRIVILSHEHQASVSQGLSSLVVERVFDIVMVALLGAVSLGFVLNVPDWFYTLIILPLAAGAVFFIALVAVGRVSSGNRYIRALLTILGQVREASLTLRSFALLSASSIAIWLLDILVCVSVVMMFQEQIPFPVVVLAIVVGNLVKAVPITPGGIGTYELALALTFSLAGVPAAEATLIAVIDHLIKNLVTLGGGIVSIYYFGGWVLDTIRTVFRKDLGGMRPGGI